jgi:hypothetical protein
MFLILSHGNWIRFYHRFATFLSFLIAIYLIVIKASSTGMLLGLGVFLMVYVLVFVLTRKNKFIKYSLLFLGFLSIVAVCFYGKELLKIVFGDSFIYLRIWGKIYDVFTGEGLNGFIVDRNLQALFEKPYFIIFGAGEGAFFRFIDIAQNNELHSTLLGLLFYYGILPFVVLMSWIIKNIKKGKPFDFCVYVAMFVEMLTLINHRQASLWIIFVIASSIIPQGKTKKNSNCVDEQQKGNNPSKEEVGVRENA